MFGKGKVELLSDKTFQYYNIDVSKLPSNSNHKVMVRCTRCNEEFLRVFCKLHQLHACPTHIVRDDGIKLKWCNKCSQFLSYNQFSQNKSRYDGLSSLCATCAQMGNSAKKHNDTKKLRRKHDFDYWLKSFLGNKIAACKKHNIPFIFSFDDLKELWAHQNGRCYYSNIKLTFAENTMKSATLERLDSTKGYIYGNVVWASRAMNHMKNSASYNEFSDFLEHACFAKHTPVRIECVLTRPDAKIPYKGRTTDAGYDLYSIEDVIVEPGKVADIHTGIKLSTPPGYFYTIEGRSSMWQKGIMPFSAIVDATYTGEVMIALLNISKHPIEIKKYDRVAQIILQKIYDCDIVTVNDFGPIYNQRGTAGFGSSGR